MTVVSTTDFRANMTKFFALADSGEHVVVQSRQGSYSLKPVKPAAKKAAKTRRRNVTEEVCRGLKDFRAYLDGDMSKVLTWEEMMHELRD